MAASATLDPIAASAVTHVAILVAPADGVRVLREVFQSLQGGFPGALVILAHTGTGRERSIADNLNVASSVMVHPGVSGVRLRNGHAYVVRPDARLAIGADGRLTDAYGSDADDDVLLLGGDGRGSSSVSGRSESLIGSLAARYGPNAIAVALTALDDLEREAFAQIRSAGGHTLSLDESDRLWADSSGPRVVPDPSDELLPTTGLGPRMIAMTHLALA